MPKPSGDGARVDARILYWGVPGAGVTSNLRFIHAKLRSDHRGELRHTPTRLDPTVTYEVLPISLGEVNGVATQLQIRAVPSDPSLTATRKQLLDEIDGLVLVIDAQPERAAENADSIAELRRSLSDYGRSLDDIPLVLQYNKRDLAEDYQVEALHRELALPGCAVFEAIASEGKGVLKALTTISKMVVRNLRDRGDSRPEPPPAMAVEPPATPVGPPAISAEPPAISAEPAAMPADSAAISSASPAAASPIAADAEVETARSAARSPAVRDLAPSGAERMEAAILAESDDAAEADAAASAAFGAQDAFDQPWDALSAEAKPEAGLRLGPDVRIVSVGTATRQGQRSVRVPLVLGNDEGQTASIALTVTLDPLLDE